MTEPPEPEGKERPVAMPYELFIALRYLTAKRKQAFISVISLISVLGVIVGVAALVIALALMTGFQQDIRAKILGANAHLTVFGSWAGKPIEDPGRVIQALHAVPGVAAAAPVVLLKGLMVSDLNPGGAGVVLKGIRLEEERRVTDVAANVRGGDHTIFVGRVEAAGGDGGRPLLWYDRAYARLGSRPVRSR